MKRGLALLCLSLAATLPWAPTVAAAVDSPTLLVQANGAYDAGEFRQATTLYEQLLARGADSGWLYYNLGNAYLRQNMLGRAIAAYRRAEVRLPRQSDVRGNLQFARQQARDALAPVEPTPLMRTVFFWHYGLSYHELTVAAAAINGLFWLCVTALRWRRQSEWLRWLSTAFGVILSLLFGSLIWRSLITQDIAVISQPEVDIHSGTSADTVIRFKLHEGTEAWVLDSQDDWLRIELSDGKQGWVEGAHVTQVVL